MVDVVEQHKKWQMPKISKNPYTQALTINHASKSTVRSLAEVLFLLECGGHFVSGVTTTGKSSGQQKDGAREPMGEHSHTTGKFLEVELSKAYTQKGFYNSFASNGPGTNVPPKK